MGFRAEIACLGDQVRPGLYELHSRFERVTNFLDPLTGQLVSVVTPEIGAGPNHIVLDSEWDEGDAVARLSIDQHTICLDDRCYPIGQLPRYDSRLEMPEKIDRRLLLGNVRFLREFLVENAPPKSLAFLLAPEREVHFSTRFEREVVARFKSASRQMLAGQVLQALLRVRGLGWGLTPSGDDFALGVLMARQILGLPGFRPAIRTDMEDGLSRVFLEQVAEGFFNEKWKLLAQALTQGSRRAVALTAARVLKIGSTSGADSAVGLVIGIKCRGTHG